MLPTYIPLKLFKSIHSAIRRFVWKNKRPRLKRQKLQSPIKDGGLALPNLIYYHWASQLRFVTDWVKDSQFSFTDLESIGLENVSISDLPFVCSTKLQITMKDNFIATNICKTLVSIRKYFGLDHYLFLAPIVNNPDFEYTCVDVGFRDWKDAGITKIDYVYR